MVTTGLKGIDLGSWPYGNSTITTDSSTSPWYWIYDPASYRIREVSKPIKEPDPKVHPDQDPRYEPSELQLLANHEFHKLLDRFKQLTA